MEKIPKNDHVPTIFSTFDHPPEFWEEYGRVIATYGFLEHTLYCTISLFSGIQSYPVEELPEKIKRRMRKAITDSLSPLIGEFEKAIRGYPDAKLRGLEVLLDRLNETKSETCFVTHFGDHLIVMGQLYLFTSTRVINILVNRLI